MKTIKLSFGDKVYSDLKQQMKYKAIVQPEIDLLYQVLSKIIKVIDSGKTEFIFEYKQQKQQ